MIVDTADCAIGRESASMVLKGLEGFRDDYEEHILRHRCLCSLNQPVPCVALCPAGVDIPGYIALVAEGQLCRRSTADPQGQPVPDCLCDGMRASL